MKKTAFLFPGQGAQYPRMADRLCNQSEAAAAVFTEASDVLGYDLLKLCAESTKETLANTLFTQPAVFTLNVAWFRALKDKLPTPQFMAGHSLGEFAAFVCGGVLSFKDALQIIQVRAKLMNDALQQGAGVMSAINGLSADNVHALCGQVSRNHSLVSVAAFNSSSQTVVSGHTSAVEALELECTRTGAEAVRLKVSAPFHSPLMKDAAAELNVALSQRTYKRPSCKIISNVTGAPYQEAASMIENLTRQMTMPIRWHHTMNYLQKSGVFYFVELGPGKTLRNLLRGVNGVMACAMDDEKDLNALTQSLSDNITSLSTLVTRSLAIAVSIRNNSNDEQAYHQEVVQPIREIKKIQQRIESSREMPGPNDITHSIEMFCQILKGKKISDREAHLRYEQLLAESGYLHLLPA